MLEVRIKRKYHSTAKVLSESPSYNPLGHADAHHLSSHKADIGTLTKSTLYWFRQNYDLNNMVELTRATGGCVTITSDVRSLPPSGIGYSITSSEFKWADILALL